MIRRKHFGAGNFFRIGVVNSVHARGLQNHVGLDLHGAQRRGRVGGKIGIAGARGENHDAAFFEMPRGAPANERLGDLLHLDRAQQARVATLLFERVLQREAVDHRRQHAHVVGGGAVDRQGLLARAAENIAAADHDGDLHAEVAHFFHFMSDTGDRLGVNPEALRTLKGLTGKF